MRFFQNGLILLLFSNSFLGIHWIGRLLSDEKEGNALWFNIAVSSGIAFVLRFFYGQTIFCIAAAIVLLIGISAGSYILFCPDKKILVFYICTWLSVVFLTDTFLYLIFAKYFSLPHFVWISILLLWRIPVIYAAFTTPHFIHRVSKWSPFYQSVYGTSAVGLLAVVFLTYLSASSEDLSSLPILWAIFISALFLRIILAYSHIKYQREKELLATIALKNELLEKNYTAVNQAYSVNARLFHDFHRHLEILLDLADKSMNREIAEYIEKLSGPLREISSVVWTGDRTIDYIINSRYTKAKECGIMMKLNIEFPYNTSIHSNDLCTLLSNLLDNALEAAACPGLLGEPQIYLAIRRLQNILVIKLTNSSPAPEYSLDGNLNTTKENNGLHGWGMKNVEAAV